MSKNIYLISGLGVDERIFQHLTFETLIPKHITWIDPKKNESIEQYALRLTEQISDEKPIILGVSFGGMLAIEIAKQIDCQQVIIISSAQTRQAIPIYYRLAGWLNIHKLIPPQLYKYPFFLTYWLFGMSSTAEKKLLKAILKDMDNRFVSWAVNVIVTWKNETLIKNLIHIHGEKDYVLWLDSAQKIDLIVPNGGHLTVFKEAEVINAYLAFNLKPFTNVPPSV
jgi:pimeloyl-ACP methyl ester carboxylesterase